MLNNFKLYVNINPKTILFTDLEAIYNMNPYLENIKLSDFIISNSYEFMARFDINNYEKELFFQESHWNADEGHFIILNQDEYNEKLLEFDNFNDFFIQLKKIKNAQFNHSYALNESKIELSDYLKVLNLYGKFKCDSNIKTVVDLNNWITDARLLLSVEQKVFKEPDEDIDNEDIKEKEVV